MKQYAHGSGLKQRSKLITGFVATIFVIGLAGSIWMLSGSDSVEAVYVTQDTAVLKGNQLSGGGTDLNVGTPTALDWNVEQELDSTYFSYSGANSSRLTIESAGDYLLSLTLPLASDSLDGNIRDAIIGYVYVNGTKQDVGVAASGYIRNLSGHNASSIHLTALLDGLAVNDYVEIFVEYETIGSTNTITSDTHVLYMRNVDSETVYNATGTQTTNSTNLNQAIAYEMEWSSDTRKDSGYTHSTATSPEDITLDNADDYLVSINIPLNGAITRGNIIGKVLLDGLEVTGTQFKQGYIRNNDGHQTSSIHYTGTVTTASANQVLSVSVEQEAATGTITVGGEKATIYIERLPASGVYSGEATNLRNLGNDWASLNPDQAEWSTDNIIDTNVYTHSTSTNPHIITIQDSGNYFVSVNVPFSGSNTRVTPGIYVAINGVKVDGLEAKSGYIRSSDGHAEASLSITGLINGVGSDSDLELYTEAVVVGGNDVPITGNAQLTIVKQSVEDAMIQNQAQWYRQNSSLTPNSAWLPANQALTLTEDSRFYGDRPPLRLRMGLATGSVKMDAGVDSLDLQYATSTSGPWFNVGEQIVDVPDEFYEDYESGTVGNNLNATSTDFTNGYSAGTGTYTFDDTYSVSGSLSGEYDAVSAGDNPTNNKVLSQSYGELYYRFYIRYDAIPSNHIAILSMRDSSTNANGDIRIQDDGRLGVRDQAFTTQQQTTDPLPTNQWIRVEGHFDYANDSFEVRVYENHTSTTATETLTDSTTTYGSEVTSVRTGIVSNASGTMTLNIDDFSVDTTDWMGHLSGGTNPDWGFYDQTGLTDGANLASTVLSGGDVAQSYIESNPTPVNPNLVNSSGDLAEWDFSLDPTNASTETTYYFRLVSVNNFDITYNYYPKLKIHAPTMDEFLRGGAYFDQSRKQGFTF